MPLVYHLMSTLAPALPPLPASPTDYLGSFGIPGIPMCVLPPAPVQRVTCHVSHVLPRKGACAWSKACPRNFLEAIGRGGWWEGERGGGGGREREGAVDRALCTPGWCSSHLLFFCGRYDANITLSDGALYLQVRVGPVMRAGLQCCM